MLSVWPVSTLGCSSARICPSRRFFRNDTPDTALVDCIAWLLRFVRMEPGDPPRNGRQALPRKLRIGHLVGRTTTFVVACWRNVSLDRMSKRRHLFMRGASLVYLSSLLPLQTKASAATTAPQSAPAFARLFSSSC